MTVVNITRPAHGVAVIEMNRPDVRNAVNLELAQAISDATLACDLIIASRTAKLGLPEVKRGLAAAAGGLIRLPRRIPYHHAMELALTGEPITAEHAERLGLITRLTEPGNALTEAITLATSIASNAPLSTIASKHVIAHSSTWDSTDQWRLQSEIVDPVIASNDAIEGATAFVEKRPPVWTAT